MVRRLPLGARHRGEAEEGEAEEGGVVGQRVSQGGEEAWGCAGVVRREGWAGPRPTERPAACLLLTTPGKREG